MTGYRLTYILFFALLSVYITAVAGGAATCVWTITTGGAKPSFTALLINAGSATSYTLTCTGGSSTSVITACAATPALPAGLSFTAAGNTATCVLAGTATAAIAATKFSIAVTDTGSGNGNPSGVSISFAVLSAAGCTTPPSASDSTLINTGTAVTASVGGTLVACTTGTLSLCSISPALPVTLSLGASTCVITGTPLYPLPSTAYTVTYTSSITSTAATGTATVGISGCYSNFVAAGDTITYADSQAVAGSPTVICSGPLFTGALTYTSSPAALATNLGGSIAMDTSGVISGAVGSTPASQAYTVTGTDGTSSATFAFTIDVVATAGAPLVADCSYAEADTADLAYKANSVASSRLVNLFSCTTSGFTALSSCSIAPALPAGMSLNTGTCAISGTPTVPAVSTTYLVTATNTATTGTNVVTVALTFAVAGTFAPYACSYSVGGSHSTPATYFFNQTIATPNAISCSGGAIVSCTSSPALPTGLVLSPGCAISGKPNVTSSVQTYRITPTNAGGSGPGAVVVLSVITDSIPNVCTYTTPSPTYYTSNGAISTNTLTCPTSSALTACTVNPQLPTGLTLNAVSCAITGTPTAAQALTTYTVTPTNVMGQAVNPVTLNLTVLANAVPSGCVWTTPVPSTYFVGTKIVDNILNCTGTYVGSAITACGGSVPAGLTVALTSGFCTISGTPTSTVTNTSFQVTALNLAGSATGIPALYMTVNNTAPSGCTYGTPSPTYYGTTVAIPSNTLTCTGGTAPTSCQVTPTLPGGLSISTACQITGTLASSVAATTVHSVQPINGIGAGSNISISIGVAPDVIPSSCVFSPKTSISLYMPVTGAAAALSPSNILTCSVGSVPSGTPTACDVTPPLPAGLALSTTCTITGTPTAVSAPGQVYNFIPANAIGAATDPVPIVISVYSPTVPSGCSYSTSAPSYFLGTAITPNVFSCAGSGYPVTSCTVTPPLPLGLTLAAAPTVVAGVTTVTACTISGKGTVVSPLTNYTVTPINAFGPISASITLPLAVTYFSPPPYPPPAYPPPYPPAGYPPPYPPRPFPPAPPGVPLPTNNSYVPQASTPRADGESITAINQTTTLTVSNAACTSINNNPAPFLVAYQIATASAWNKANPTLLIKNGDVVFAYGYVPPSLLCTPSSGHKRSLRQGTNTVTVVNQIWTPPNTTAAQALAATAGFLVAAQQQYVSGQFASDYQVLSASTTATAPFTTKYTTPSSPSSPSSSSSNTLAIGLGVGLGVGGAVIIGGIVAFVVMRRKDDQTVAPK